MVIAMEPEEEFEFEFDEDEEEPEEEKPKSKKSSSKDKKSRKKVKTDPLEEKKEPETKVSSKKAQKVPLPEGVKKRLRKDIKDLSRLKGQLESLKDDKDSFQREFELLEDELENLRSEKDKIEGDMNSKIAMINALEKKLDRNQKDFENFKKRNESELERKVKMGSKKLILGIIDVLDNLDRALTEAKKNDWKSSVRQMIDGIESIRKGVLKVLHDNGIEVIDPINEVFDPNFHEAISMIEDDTVFENTVIDVDVKGYVVEGIVLRAAKVRVSKGGKPRPKKIKEEKDEGKSIDKDGEKEGKNKDIDEVENVEEVDEELEEIEEIVDNMDVQ